MARAPRKRAPATAAAKRTTPTKPTTTPEAPEVTTPPSDETKATSPVEAPEAASPPEANSPVEELVATFWRALDERDVVTGTIPAVQLDAARLAYRAVPRHQRGNLATKLNAQAAEKMVLGDGTVDAGLAVAMGHLAALFATTNGSNGTHQRAPHDPVPEVAAILATLDATRDLLLAALSDDQRERIADAATTDRTQATRDKVATKLAPIVNRALNGTPSRSARTGTGTRADGPARDLGAIVRDAVQTAGETLFLSTIGRENGISTGALGNRWAKDNIPGITAVEVDGRKAFAAA